MRKVTKKDYENENFLIILNYVETTEPDYIAKDIEQKDKRIAELEKQLAIRDKALELSLKDVIRYPVQLCMKEYWLEQAEKELKGEK